MFFYCIWWCLETEDCREKDILIPSFQGFIVSRIVLEVELGHMTKAVALKFL